MPFTISHGQYVIWDLDLKDTAFGLELGLEVQGHGNVLGFVLELDIQFSLCSKLSPCFVNTLT